MTTTEDYAQRLIASHGVVMKSGRSTFACADFITQTPVDAAHLQQVMVEAGGKPVLLCGTHKPLLDQFPAEHLQQVAARFAHNPMQRNHAFKQYGQLLGWELRFLGYSILHLPLEHDGQAVFAEDAESNGESLAALWAGLRSEGVALCTSLPASNGMADWAQIHDALISGVPFITVDYPLATAQTLSDLLEQERFSGVAMVSGLAASGLTGEALTAEALRLLDMGWHVLLLDDFSDDAAASLLQALQHLPIQDKAVHHDALGRLQKRFTMLAAVEERGKGFITLDRSPEYLMQRRVLAHKLQISDDYAFQERPARFGSMVRFTYQLQIDGELRDENDGDGLRTILGKGQVVPGLEDALLGCRVGQDLSVDVAAADAYGEHEQAMVHHIPRQGVFLAPGQKLVVGGTATIPRQGEVIYGRITAINDAEVIVDANHELAGKDLHFDIKIHDVI